MEKPVDNVDNWCFFRVRGLITSPLYPEKTRRKWAGWLGFVTFSGKSDGGRRGPGPTNFVKNRQSRRPFALFRAMYRFPALGNTVGETDKQEDAICREKWRSAG